MTFDDDLTPGVAGSLLVAAVALGLVVLVWWCGQRDEAGITAAIEVSPAATERSVDRVETPEDSVGPLFSGENDMAWIGWRAHLWAGVTAAAPAPAPDPDVSSITIERQPSGEVVITNPPEAPIAVVPQGELEELICSFSWDCGTALRVVECESRGDPHAVGRAGERGLFQIHPVHAPALGARWEALFDPTVNVAVAHEMWVSQGWRPWSCAR